MFNQLQEKFVALLLWSQKYTKLDMLYLARGSFWVTFSQILTSILSLGLTIAFANLLPKETYGTYKYILALASVLNIFTLTGMSTSLSRSVARGADVIRPAVIYQLKWNLLMCAAFLLVGVYYLINENITYMHAFILLGIFVPPSIALNSYGAYLEGRKEFRFLNISRVLSTLMYVSGTFVVLLWNGTVEWLIFAYAITTFISALFAYLYTLRRFNPAQDADIKETISYARELTYIKFIDPIASQIDKIILAHFWGAAQLATYSIATALPNRAILFMKSLVNIGLPKFATKTPEMLNTVFYKRIILGLLIGTCMTLAYVVISPYVYAYVLPQYVDAIAYSQLLAITFIFAIPNRYIALLLSSQRMSRTLFNRALIQSVINVVLYCVLGILGGLIGLIVANILINIISLFLNIWLWRSVSSKKASA